MTSLKNVNSPEKFWNLMWHETVYMTMAQDKEHGEIRRPRCPFGRERWEEKGGRCLDWEAAVRPGQKIQGIWKAHGFWKKSPPNQIKTENYNFACSIIFDFVEAAVHNKPEQTVLEHKLLAVVVKEGRKRLWPVPGNLSHKTLTPIKSSKKCNMMKNTALIFVSFVTGAGLQMVQ